METVIHCSGKGYKLGVDESVCKLKWNQIFSKYWVELWFSKTGSLAISSRPQRLLCVCVYSLLTSPLWTKSGEESSLFFLNRWLCFLIITEVEDHAKEQGCRWERTWWRQQVKWNAGHWRQDISKSLKLYFSWLHLFQRTYLLFIMKVRSKELLALREMLYIPGSFHAACPLI